MRNHKSCIINILKKINTKSIDIQKNVYICKTKTEKKKKKKLIDNTKNAIEIFFKQLIINNNEKNASIGTCVY